jgi:hypothetical protein
MRSLFSIYLICGLGYMPASAAVQARELPCNDVCRWWLDLGATNPSLGKESTSRVLARSPVHRGDAADQVSSRAIRPRQQAVVRRKSLTAAHEHAQRETSPRQALHRQSIRNTAAVVLEPSRSAGGFPSGIPVSRRMPPANIEPAEPPSVKSVSSGSDWEQAALQIFERSGDTPSPVTTDSRRKGRTRRLLQ